MIKTKNRSCEIKSKKNADTGRGRDKMIECVTESRY